MKHLLISILGLTTLLNSCNKDELITQESIQNQKPKISNTAPTTNRRGVCVSEEMRKEALASDPELMKRYLDIERNLASHSTEQFRVGRDGTVTIPVIVNVLYRTDAENISDAVIHSQIQILNEDFSATNSDYGNIPQEFKRVAAGDTKIRFELIKINRKKTRTVVWKRKDEAMKKIFTGIKATDPKKHLNIWVVGEIENRIAGFAKFPENAGQWNDGVVIRHSVFGKNNNADYNKGRTTTHEVGHYLNLHHIWGGIDCGDDFCNDTPQAPGPNFDNPIYPLYGMCDGIDRSLMFMNYMDYVEDSSMFMFTNDQKNRMRAVVAANGPRAGLR